MTPVTLTEQVRRHGFLARVLEASGADAMGRAEAIWSGIAGSGNDPLSQAVSETLPERHAAFIASDDIVAAHIVALGVQLLRGEPLPEPAFRARRWAMRELWPAFERALEARESGRGNDDSWPMPVRLPTNGRALSDPRLQRISELAGRMYRILRASQRRRVHGIPEDVVGVQTGSDVERLVPDEIALWACGGGARVDLAIRIEEGRAIHLEVEGTEHEQRGPLVVALDESGSMEGDRDTWAKAAMTALTRLAWNDRRPVKVVHFSTATRTHELRPGNYAALQRAQLTFLSGGTYIGAALSVAADEVETWRRQGVQGADVALISDGTDDPASCAAALERFRGSGVRLFGVAVECAFSGVLRRACAEYVQLSGGSLDSAESIDILRGAVL